MRAITASKVIQGAVELTGRLFTKLSNDELPVFIGSFNRNLRTIWETEFWPSLMVTEERYFRDVWSSGSYAPNAEVYHSGTDAYYKNTSGGSTSGVPGTSSDWTQIKEFSPYISFTQTGKTEIGQVYKITSADPREKLNYDTVEFTQKDDQVIVNYPRQNSYWVEFRQRAPIIKAEKWSASVTYSAGDQVYYTSSGQTGGDFYDALSSNTNSAPSSVNANWAKVNVPYIFGPYLEHSIAADILLIDEKLEFAGIQMRAKDRALEAEMMRAKNQSGDAFTPRFKTY
jgi:hypothetical protein